MNGAYILLDIYMRSAETHSFRSFNVKKYNMAYELAGAGISAGGGLVSGLVGGLFAERNARIQYKYNSQLQAQQHQFALEQMAAQNDYARQAYELQRDDERAWNNESAVVNRLRNAGLSAAAYFNGGASGGSIGADMTSGAMPSGPSAAGVSQSPFNPGNINLTGSFIDALRAMSEIKTQQYNNARTEAETNWLNEKVISESNMNSVWSYIRDGIVSDSLSKRSRAVVDSVNARFAELDKITDLNQKMAVYNEILARIKNYESSSRLSDSEAAYFEGMTRRIDYLIRKDESEIRSNDANTRHTNALADIAENEAFIRSQTIQETIDMLKANKDKVLQELDNLKSQGVITSTQAQYIDRLMTLQVATASEEEKYKRWLNENGGIRSLALIAGAIGSSGVGMAALMNSR